MKEATETLALAEADEAEGGKMGRDEGRDVVPVALQTTTKGRCTRRTRVGSAVAFTALVVALILLALRAQQPTRVELEGTNDDIADVNGEGSDNGGNAHLKLDDAPPPADYFPDLPETPHDSDAAAKLLPPTSAVPYNELAPNDRFLVYSPSGGWSNQLWCLGAAMLLARMSNRTLLVPPAALHTNGWQRYESLEMDRLMPFDRILDFARMNDFFTAEERALPASAPTHRAPPEKRNRLVALNVPLDAWRKRVAADAAAKGIHHFLEVKSLEVHTHDETKADLVKNHAHIVFLHGKGFYGLWFGVPQHVFVRRFMRPAPAVRRIAYELVRSTFGAPGSFNAIHVRLGDYRYRANTPEWWLAHVRNAGFVRRKPLYIATDALGGTHRADYFALLTKNYNVTFHDGLIPRELAKSYAFAFPKATRSDFFGYMEQLVCAQAARFLPSSYSTFSAHITFLRGHLADVLPELDAHALGGMRDDEHAGGSP